MGTGELKRGLSYEEYCALPGINASLLKVVSSHTLMHAKAYLDGKLERESDALDFGKLFHELLLRGREDFVVRPDAYTPKEGAEPKPWTFSAHMCKAWRDAQGDKTILSVEEATNLRAMVEAVRANEELSEHLNGDYEIAAVADKNGVPLKILVDLLPTFGPVIDFKKTRSAHPARFVKSAVDLGYHIQAAFYLDVLKLCGVYRKEFWFVAVEEQPPYALSVIRYKDVPVSYIWAGRAAYRRALVKLVNAQKLNQWPGHESIDAEEVAPAYHKEMLDNQ